MAKREAQDLSAEQANQPTTGKENTRAKTLSNVNDPMFTAWVEQSLATAMAESQCQPSSEYKEAKTIVDELTLPAAEVTVVRDIATDSSVDITDFQQLEPQKLKNCAEPKSTDLLIIAGQTTKCGVEDRGEHLQILGDFPSLFSAKFQEVSMQIKELCSDVLGIPKQKIGLTPLLDVTLEAGLMTTGCRLTLPNESFENVVSTEFVQCIQTYTNTLFSPLPWTDALVNETPVNSPSRLAVLAAKKVRSTRGGYEIPEGAQIVCSGWQQPVRLRTKIGPAPEKAKLQVKLEWNGAFRGYHFDDREGYFSLDCRVQSKSKKLLFKVELFEKIKALSGRDFTKCTVRLIEHRIGEECDHYELVEIVGETDDLFGKNSEPQ